MTKQELILKLNQEFSLRRRSAELFSEQQKEKALQDKVYFSLELEERNLILDLSKANFQKKPTEALEKKLLSVQKLKLIRLNGLNIDPKTLTSNYSCKECDDTGVTGHTYCTCYRQAYNNLLMQQSNIEFEHLPTLSNYDLSIYEKPEQEQMQKLITVFQKLTQNLKNSKIKNFVLCGATGVGKTQFSKSVAKEVMKKGFTTYYVSAFELNNLMLKYHTTFNENKLEILEPVLTSDLLIVDDLGTEPILKNVTLEYLLLILNERVEHNKVTIITTNLGPNHILARYNERIFSRLMNKKNSLLVELKGKDLRLKKNSKFLKL